MNKQFDQYTNGFSLSGDLKRDISLFFTINEDLRTLEHTLDVTAEAHRIADLFTIDPNQVISASLLHDISNVIPVSTMLDVAKELSIEILEEENKYNRSVHQKLSMFMAKDIFGISDREILLAIESHTTYRAQASMTAKILFVADKISWKLPGEHPHLIEMRERVNNLEIDKAILIYLNYIWEQRDKLKLVHPWLIKAREDLIKVVY
ncbi:bis(5'-nucleosyl)-tetraphosphatase (symmetrical) YqeK [Paenibacillus sp. Marseille-Q4541]|uniref:bis(5'-nucleosyl)-tetraphosphatase (symmetrical) YqeK n=1 Tax=Paenibacillus sp. Marseille-Q4541 TaxID=2831522 RepID=UPI001BADD17A|nr:bis(5'-nucleosyl)-tetraphosphatase (symmetrical) YqeK [Paenibacillus sp. Marseille-Q4541]